MSGFSAEWLALREPADQRSRAPQFSFKIAARLANLIHAHIVDLGCGTGSNLRALAPVLSNEQYWRLVDHDPNLLAQARILLKEWADYAEVKADEFILYYDDKIIHVHFESHDLRQGLQPLLNQRVDLVTSSALFDLMSADWIKTMAAELAQRNILFHTALSYDGRIQWFPPHRFDEDIQTSFNQHQKSDKGFGLACGPDSTQTLCTCFSAHGYQCEIADSPWIITRNEEADLLDQLGNGIAEAAAHTLDDIQINDWMAALAGRRSVLIGHQDMIAYPPSPEEDAP